MNLPVVPLLWRAMLFLLVAGWLFCEFFRSLDEETQQIDDPYA